MKMDKYSNKNLIIIVQEQALKSKQIFNKLLNKFILILPKIWTFKTFVGWDTD